jgi:glucose-6-phosphate 1-dehydrogenase
MTEAKENIPTVLVVFGVTGDLMARKVAPALFHLHKKGRLPNMFKVIGVARREYTDEKFRQELLSNLIKHKHFSKKDNSIKSFLNLISYHQGYFEKRDAYKKLAEKVNAIDEKWGVCTNKLFYLSVPPKYYEGIFRNLAATGLTKPCGPGGGWTRVLVEKPFGKDLKTAKELDTLLGKLFKEEQIYRIDHYLAKEMLQNILTFRFSNSLFEQSMNNEFVDRIEIRFLETLGVEERGGFYDGLGSLRDVGQNHILQMLALATMENPKEFKSELIREERARILQKLKIPSKNDIKNNSYRAQYLGYREIKGVSPNSMTETYFKIEAYLNSSRWKGVPIIIEGGKKLGDVNKEVVVVFKHPNPCLCPKETKKHDQNEIIFSLEPKEGITVSFLAKQPGLAMTIGKKSLDFVYREKRKEAQYVEEYEKLLLDCIAGDQTLFVSTEEVRAMWKFVDPFVSLWTKGYVPLKTYQSGTDDALKQSRNVEQNEK